MRELTMRVLHLLVLVTAALLALVVHVSLFTLAAVAIVVLRSDGARIPPVDAAEIYPGIDLTATAVDGPLTLTVTTGDDEVIVLEPYSHVTVDEAGGVTRWVWETPPNTGRDATPSIEPENRPGRRVPPNTTVDLIAFPDRAHPAGAWEVCTDLASSFSHPEGNEPDEWVVWPAGEGTAPARLCAMVDTEEN